MNSLTTICVVAGCQCWFSSSVVSTLFVEPGSLCEPGTCYSSYTGWAASLRDYPVSINHAPCKDWDRVGVVAHCWNSTPALTRCLGSEPLPTESCPQPLVCEILLFFLNLFFSLSFLFFPLPIGIFCQVAGEIIQSKFSFGEFDIFLIAMCIGILNM